MRVKAEEMEIVDTAGNITWMKDSEGNLYGINPDHKFAFRIRVERAQYSVEVQRLGKGYVGKWREIASGVRSPEKAKQIAEDYSENIDS